MILGVIYAPPGCTSTASAQCASPSTVDYSSGSSLGTKVSTKDSFKAGFTATVDAGGIMGAGASAGFAVTQSDSTSVTITKASALDIKTNGNGDGIDHGQDQFILLLNPTVTLNKQARNIYWKPGFSGPSLARYEVYVSELRNPSTMRPTVAAELQQLGFTTKDYQTILSMDPFGGTVNTRGGRFGGIVAGGQPVATEGGTGPTLDSTRFVPTTWSFPYEPPLQSPNCNNGVCSCTIFSGTIKNDFLNEATTETQGDYTVDLKTSIGVADVWDLKTDWQFTWTSSSSTTNSTGSTQSATATIACPSVTYTGPTMVQIYWDKLFGTFLFVPYNLAAASVVHQGKVTDASGQPVRGQRVDLAYGRKTYHTFTGPNGAYRFLGTAGQAAQWKTGLVTVGSIQQNVNLGSSQTTMIQLR